MGQTLPNRVKYRLTRVCFRRNVKFPTLLKNSSNGISPSERKRRRIIPYSIPTENRT
ncbi:predicted protein [Neisseria gonorrhoeae PID1]|nr:predicted protein [Neisseria gonorrhoeae PID18]EEZ52643.1 predicted protein [Neisseria gonorrhoeae PID1]EEZ54984.1 predicted protein [Neisseria gonorrhoeae PID332]